MNIKANNIAKYFYDKNNDFTEKQLQKLTYYAYAWYLTTYKDRLFDESPQAWIHGPVFMSLYKTLQNNELQEIDNTELIEDDSIIKLLDIVYKVYGNFSGYKLEKLTHSETPWKNARIGLAPEEKSRNIITDKDIQEYYGA